MIVVDFNPVNGKYLYINPLMKDLLSDDGSIFVHCDWRVNSSLRIIMDEIFGVDNFQNEYALKELTGIDIVQNAFDNKLNYEHEQFYDN